MGNVQVSFPASLAGAGYAVTAQLQMVIRGCLRARLPERLIACDVQQMLYSIMVDNQWTNEA